ncbi:MAG: hypothetical protein JNN27_01015 [Planctomycetes bacterium]|nr:hypothetical protein [Planctomycetota bacterium]
MGRASDHRGATMRKDVAARCRRISIEAAGDPAVERRREALDRRARPRLTVAEELESLELTDVDARVKLRRYALTGEERAWQIPAKVDALFTRFPIERAAGR